MLLLEAIKALSSAGQLNHTPPLINVYSESSCALPILRSFHLVAIEVAPWLWAFHLCCSKTSSTEGGKKKNNSRKSIRQRLTPLSQWWCSARSLRRRIGSEALVIFKNAYVSKAGKHLGLFKTGFLARRKGMSQTFFDDKSIIHSAMRAARERLIRPARPSGDSTVQFHMM